MSSFTSAMRMSDRRYSLGASRHQVSQGHYSWTSSVSTPPHDSGWMNAMRHPCAPARGAASIKRTPAASSAPARSPGSGTRTRHDASPRLAWPETARSDLRDRSGESARSNPSRAKSRPRPPALRAELRSPRPESERSVARQRLVEVAARPPRRDAVSPDRPAQHASQLHQSGTNRRRSERSCPGSGNAAESARTGRSIASDRRIRAAPDPACAGPASSKYARSTRSATGTA